MDRSTRSELVKTVEEQGQKITKYENKLRDLIRAYKGLQKEKDALEASVKVLSASSKDDSSETDTEAKTTETDPLGVEHDERSGQEEDSRPESSQTEVLKLKEQLATLTNSLATVTQEKTKMEASYQAEKKKLRLDHDTVVQELEDRAEKSEDQMEDLQAQLKEVKSKLIIHHHERDKEQVDHAVMLKELQSLVAEERNAKEQIQIQLEEVQFTLKDQQRNIPPPDMSEQYRKKITDLTNEIQALRGRLKEAEEKANRPSPLLLQLQKETAEIKAQHKMNYEQEQQRANEAIEQAKSQSLKSEKRIASLEGRLSELSDVVGNCERLRYQDQQAIQRLRERVTQLDLENTALAKAADTNKDLAAVEEFKHLDVQELIERMVKLKHVLVTANEKSEKPINVDEVLISEGVLPETDVHQHCHDEYQQLKEEFERYKLRAQSVLKNKSSKPETSKELDFYKTQVTEMREKLRDHHMVHEESETKHQDMLSSLREAMTLLEQRHRNEVSNLEADHRQKISDLELQIHKHRDRTISLLAEKDKEIEILRMNSPEQLETQYVSTYRQLSLEGDDSTSDAAGASSEESSAINRLLSKSSMLTGQGETSILHFAQEQARKDVEIKSLRKQKLSLESALRELQLNSSTKEQRYANDLDILQEEVRKHERNKSRESANLEYLKNVIYQYLVCNDWAGKTHMLNAIETILEFSPTEKRYVDEVLHQGWIQYYAGYSPKDHKKGKKSSYI